MLRDDEELVDKEYEENNDKDGKVNRRKEKRQEKK